MIWNTSEPNFLRWAFRLIEWILLLTGVLVEFLSGYFFASPSTPLQFIALFFALFGLSFIFPIHRPLWQRRLYLALEVLLGISIAWLGSGFEEFLFLALIKACILLPRREVAAFAALSGIIYLASTSWWYFFSVEPLANIPSDPRKDFLGVMIRYIGINAYLLLLGFIIVAERKSRSQAETLAREVETLAATLERTRVAREIHDSLGHTLVALGVQLEVAQRLNGDDLSSLRQAIDTAKQLADRSLEDVRHSVQTLRQHTFDLNHALQALVQLLHQNQSCQIQMQLHLPILPLPTSHQLYCILKEGLMNIQKHANASKITLRGWATDTVILVELTDNGTGFDLTKPLQGFGVQGMQERAQMIGAVLQINSIPGQGTTIQVKIPR